MSARRARKNDAVSSRADAADNQASEQNEEHSLGLFTPVAFVAIWVSLVHLSGCFGVFVFDDQSLLNDPTLQEFGSFEWFRLAKRPVTTGTFAANFTLFGPSELSCHIANVAIHTLASCFLLLVVWESIKHVHPTIDYRVALIGATCAALLWGVHPLSTAAVTYIVQRAESLASLGMLASLYCWSRAWDNSDDAARTRRHAWLFGSTVAAYVAYGSKEMSAGLPLILLIYDRVIVGRDWKSIGKNAVWYGLLVGPLILGLAIFVPRLTQSGSGRNTIGFFIEGFDPLSYFFSQPRVFLQYLKLSFFPVGQSLDYGWMPAKGDAIDWVGVIGWLVILATLVCLWRKRRVLAFALTAALLILSPTSTFIPFQDIIFEHRFYLPLAILLSCAVGKFVWRFPNRVSTVGVAVTAVLAVTLSLLTVQRNMDYTSEQRIHEVDILNHPDNPRAVYSLATTANFNEPEPKIELIRLAIKLSQEREHFYPGTDYKWPRDLADLLFLTGRTSEAREWYQMALVSAHDELQKTEVQFQLAMVASIEGRVEDAERLFQGALSGSPVIREQIQTVYQAHLSRLERSRNAAKSP